MSNVTLQFRPLTSGDDGYWTSSGSFYNNSAALYVVKDFSGVERASFITFKNTIIPKNAIITSAILKLRNVDDFGSTPQDYNIYCENVAVPTALSTAAQADALSLTDAVPWSVAQRSAIYYDSSDIKSIIQVLVDKDDWDIGKNIRVVIKQPSNVGGLPYWLGLAAGTAVLPILEVTWTLPTDWMIKNSGVAGDDGYIYNTNYEFHSGETSIALGGEDPRGVLYDRNGWFRFPSVGIPNARTINHAYLILTCKTSGGSPSTLVSYFNDEVNPIAPTTRPEYDGKSLSPGVNSWDGDFALAESIYHSPELKTDLKSIIDKVGWASGQALMLLVKDNNGVYTNNVPAYVYAYDNGSKYPLLLIQLAPISSPSGVGGVGGDHKETISWPTVAGAASYNLYWSLTPGVTKLNGTKIEGATSPYEHTDLTGDTIYYYVVTAVDAIGESEDSAEVSAKTDLPIPAAPDMSVLGGDKKITVSWPPVAFAASYNLYWSISLGVTVETGTKISGVTNSYDHTGLLENTAYFYIATSVNASGESGPSAEARVVTENPNPAPPLGVGAIGGEKKVTVSWLPSPIAVYYNIYWSRTTGVTKANGFKIEGVTSPYEHLFRLNGIHYYYIVTTVSVVGEGYASAEASARTNSYTAPPTPPAPDPVQFLGGAVGNAPYLMLFTSQYQNSGNLLNFADKILESADDVVAALETFLAAFDLDTAIGDQLDILGEIIGASRYLKFTPTGWDTLGGVVPPRLDSATYRLLLKATIGINHWDGRISSIKPLWEALFPDGYLVIKDELDMSITVTPAGVFSNLILQLISHDLIIPRPEGVLINYVFGEMPFFGFDLDNEYIAGFDHGKWA